MNKQDIQDLVMGAAVVAVGFILYKQFKRPAATAGSGLAPFVNDQVTSYYDPTLGAPYNTESVAGRMGLADLWSGINQNSYSGTGYDYLGSITNPQLTGNGGHDSIYVKGWWN